MNNKLIHKSLLREFRGMYAKRASLQEIKRFITKPRQSSGGEIYGIEQVNDIRNALYMPMGFRKHVEILNLLCGVPDSETREEWEDYESPRHPGHTMSRVKARHKISDDVIRILMSIDKQMQPVMRRAFETNILGKKGSMYSQGTFPDSPLSKSGPGAWPLFESLISEVFDPDAESALDVERYFNPETKGKKKKSPPGKYDPVSARYTNPDLSGSYETDIVDAIVNDMVDIILDVEDDVDVEDFDATYDRFTEMIDHLKEDGYIDDPLAPDEINSLNIIMRKELASAESKLLAREADRTARAPGVNFREIIKAINNSYNLLMSRFSANTPAKDLPAKFVDLLMGAIGLLDRVKTDTGEITPTDIVPSGLDEAIGNFVNEVHDALMEMLGTNARLLGVYMPVIEDEQPIYDSFGDVTYEEDGVIDQHFDETGKMYRTQWEEGMPGL